MAGAQVVDQVAGAQVVLDQVAGAQVVVDGPSERRSGSGGSSGGSLGTC